MNWRYTYDLCCDPVARSDSSQPGICKHLARWIRAKYQIAQQVNYLGSRFLRAAENQNDLVHVAGMNVQQLR